MQDFYLQPYGAEGIGRERRGGMLTKFDRKGPEGIMLVVVQACIVQYPNT